MSSFDPNKLNVEFKDGITETDPILQRRYTLTHDDSSGELYLTIGQKYDYEKLNSNRDEVLAEWVYFDCKFYLYVYLYVDGQFGPITVSIRNMIFRKELPLALTAIMYSDKEFLKENESLCSSNIIVYFNSSVYYYNKVEDWGTPSMYMR